MIEQYKVGLDGEQFNYNCYPMKDEKQGRYGAHAQNRFHQYLMKAV
jgi:hypothetical protein